ncbi:MAG: DnaJ domain-containing protein [Candidatus Berkiella sp.]
MDKEPLDLSQITQQYSILGVPLSATKDELRRARNKLLHLFHPDKQPRSEMVGEDEPNKRAYLIQSAYLYIIEHYDEIRQSLDFLSDASFTNRMPVKARSHWIYTAVASYDNQDDSCHAPKNPALSKDADDIDKS